MKKTVLITGGSRGIGNAIKNKFIKESYNILCPTRSEMDLSDTSSIEKYCQSIDEEIDVIINCAGINTIAKLETLDDNSLNSMLQINLLAPIKIIKCLSNKMRKHNLGHIINISSIWSVVAKDGRMGYSATKSAINGVTRTLALEYANKNILINSVAPGYVNTELTKQNNSETEIDKISKQIPIQRLAEPEEIANLVFFLSSDQNTYITGQTIIIDGGFTCQ